MSTWKVVDANFLRSPLIKGFFRANPGNRVVFTDHACMESYKGPGLVNLARSLEIVSRYSSQVIVLLSTRKIIALQSKSGYTPTTDSFIDQEQTHDFRRFCLGVQDAVVSTATN